MDVKSVFLNDEFKEEVYVEQPLRYTMSKKEHKVFRLKKPLDGLKQALRVWNMRINSYFKENDFKQCPFEATIYVKVCKDKLLIVALYVNDLIFMGNN
jgi:Reverse transcriptase (RNA-dependent DNA polymerase)